MTDTISDVKAAFHKYLKNHNLTTSLNEYELYQKYNGFVTHTDLKVEDYIKKHLGEDNLLGNIGFEELARIFDIIIKPDIEDFNNSDSHYGTLGFIFLYVICAIVFLFMMYKIIRCYRLRRRNHEDANNDVENKSSNENVYNLIDENDADEDADNPSERKAADEDADNP